MSLRVAVSGSSGLIGSALVAALRARGDGVVRIVRREPVGPGEVRWAPGATPLPADALAGVDALVALGGASVGRLPWTPAYRARLRASRLRATRTLVDALHAAGDSAPAFLSASAVGLYGSRPGIVLDEGSPAGETFLARLCADWEAEARRAEDVSRVALLRTASVLDPEGVLRPLIALSRAGLGGRIGPGTQVWPWISLVDEVRAILHVLSRRLAGPVDLCGPEPASADRITRVLAETLGRPHRIPAPAWALRAALGPGAADSLLLADADVRPRVLERTGFEFRHRTAGEAVRAALA